MKCFLFTAVILLKSANAMGAELDHSLSQSQSSAILNFANQWGEKQFGTELQNVYAASDKSVTDDIVQMANPSLNFVPSASSSDDTSTGGGNPLSNFHVTDLPPPSQSKGSESEMAKTLSSFRTNNLVSDTTSSSSSARTMSDVRHQNEQNAMNAIIQRNLEDQFHTGIPTPDVPAPISEVAPRSAREVETETNNYANSIANSAATAVSLATSVEESPPTVADEPAVTVAQRNAEIVSDINVSNEPHSSAGIALAKSMERDALENSNKVVTRRDYLKRKIDTAMPIAKPDSATDLYIPGGGSSSSSSTSSQRKSAAAATPIPNNAINIAEIPASMANKPNLLEMSPEVPRPFNGDALEMQNLIDAKAMFMEGGDVDSTDIVADDVREYPADAGQVASESSVSKASPNESGRTASAHAKSVKPARSQPVSSARSRTNSRSQRTVRSNVAKQTTNSKSQRAPPRVVASREKGAEIATAEQSPPKAASRKSATGSEAINTLLKLTKVRESETAAAPPKAATGTEAIDALTRLTQIEESETGAGPKTAQSTEKAKPTQKEASPSKPEPSNSDAIDALIRESAAADADPKEESSSPQPELSGTAAIEALMKETAASNPAPKAAQPKEAAPEKAKPSSPKAASNLKPAKTEEVSSLAQELAAESTATLESVRAAAPIPRTYSNWFFLLFAGIFIGYVAYCFHRKSRNRRQTETLALLHDVEY